MLKKISLKNFMCHEHLELNLNPRVNFITGANGSGKSAIVTGLMVGLGQNAFSTNRASSLKSFVKRGKHSAVIEITFANSAENAYKEEIYGIEFMISRKITSTNCNYSLKDAKGEIHPFNAKDLHYLLLHFNIQPNNPLCILNQDVARTFFSRYDPKALYTIFVNANLLKNINKIYADSKEISEKNSNLLARKKIELEELTKEVEFEQKLKKVESRIKQYEEINRRVKAELACAKVMGIKETMDNLQKKRSDLNSEKKEILEKIQECKVSVAEPDIREFMDKLLEFKKIVNSFCEERQQVEQKMTLIEEECETLKKQYHQNKSSILMKDKEIKYFQNMIEECDRKNKEEYLRQQDELRCLNVREQEVKHAIETAQAHLMEMEGSLIGAEMNMISINNEIKKIEKSKGEHQAKIKQLVENTHPRGFGRWMYRVLDEIESKEMLFTKKPKGPLGMYLTVKDGFWALAIEHFMKGHLTAFILNDFEDFQIFNEIVQKFAPNHLIPDAIICKFTDKVHNFSKFEIQHGKYSSLIRQLECSDVDVLNSLIDELYIERVLLVPNVEDTFDLCEKIENVPKHLSLCLTADGDKVYPSPNYKFFSGRIQIQESFLIKVANNSQGKMILEQAHLGLMRSAEELRKEKNEMENHVRRIKEEMFSTEKSIKSQQEQLKVVKSKQFQLQSSIHSEAPASEESITKDVLKLVTARDEVIRINEDISNELSSKMADFNKLEKKEDLILKEIRDVDEKKEEIMQKMNLAEKKLHDFLSDSKLLNGRLNAIVLEDGKILEQMESMRKTLLDRKDLAENVYGGKIKLKKIRSLHVLNMQSKWLKDELSKLKAMQCEFYAISKEKRGSQDFSPKIRKLGRKRKFFSYLEEKHKLSNQSLQEEMRVLRLSEENIFKESRKLFSQLLKERNLNGTLTVDNEKETVQIKLYKVNEEKALEKFVLSSLSGGEKTLATTCFIMTVWNSMSVPFFVMDEFDVFADLITRDTILRMLIAYATRTSAQFLFVTPHDLTRIDNQPDITVHLIEAAGE